MGAERLQHLLAQRGRRARKRPEFIRKLGLGAGTLGVEKSFMPADFFSRVAKEELPGARVLDAHYLLDQLRAIKRPDEPGDAAGGVGEDRGVHDGRWYKASRRDGPRGKSRTTSCRRKYAGAWNSNTA